MLFMRAKVKVMNDMQLDILAFGAHPDDVEIGMGGTIAKYAQKGAKIGICDLTKAELSSNGTVEKRQMEAEKAGHILNISTRIQLTLPDRGLYLKEEYVREIVQIIRKYRPKIIFAPYFEDRHPDHGHCAKLVEEAFFSSGIKKYNDNENLFAYRADALYFYMINGFHKPDFVVDISETMDKKIASLEAYSSQFEKTEDGVMTPLTDGYVETVKSREHMFGKEVNRMYAEGFKVNKPFIIENDLLGGHS